MLELRRVFDKYRIAWRDRGPNTSRGNIVISCPFCNKTANPDRGEHLGIFEETGQYNCLRNPRHRGTNVLWLFRALHIPDSEYKGQKFAPVERTEKDEKDYSAFQYFLPAEESREALDYLSSRLFSSPVDVAQKFKLKVASHGKWAGRLIIPLTIGWTGRAMRGHIEPRYLAHTSDSGFFFFSGNKNTSVIILEGAIDAMRVATVSSQFDVIGKCGNRLSASLLLHLRTRRYFSLFNSPDSDVPYLQHQEDTRILRSYCTWADVVKSEMPEKTKDYGMMREVDARRWVAQNLQGGRSNGGAS